MFRPTVLISGLLLAVLPLHGAEQQEDPNVAANAKLRETLRNTMTQLRTAQGDLAMAQAGQTAAEAKVKDLTAKLDSLSKQSSADRTEARQKIETLTATADDLASALNATKATLKEWMVRCKEAVDFANAKEVERSRLADENSILRAKVRDHRAQNLELYRLADEILTRYQQFGLGQALKAREPFTGITRARLETQVQDYRDKADDLRIRPEAGKAPAPAPAPAASKKPAAAPARH